MVTRRTLLAGLAATGMAGPAAASPMVDYTALLAREGRYYPGLIGSERTAAANPDSLWMTASMRAAVGDEAGAFAAVAEPEAEGVPLPALDGFAARPALAEIVARARDRRIVILNEAHHAAHCRVFAEQVAGALRGIGFNSFAAEAFPNRPGSTFAATMNAGGAVTTEWRNYLIDPCFAELTRGVRRLGYRLWAYEGEMPEGAVSRAESVSRRDGAEAANLARALRDDPEARLLIYCGPEHLLKAETDGIIWMAGQLKGLTGIDPLCITQAYGVPAPDPRHDTKALRAVLERFAPTQPVVIADAAGKALVIDDLAADLAVVHPRLPAINGRPGWLAEAPGRRRADFTVDPAGLSTGLLQAVRPGGPVNEVPADQFRYDGQARSVSFFLKPGAYDVLFEDMDGRRRIGALQV